MYFNFKMRLQHLQTWISLLEISLRLGQGGEPSDAITITMMDRATGAQMVAVVVSARRGEKMKGSSIEDNHKKTMCSAAGRKGRLTMLLAARKNRQMVSTTGEEQLKPLKGFLV